MKQQTKKLMLVVGLIVVMAGITIPAVAAGEGSDKEEVVYGMLAGDGSVSDVYVVNIFDKQSGGIIDYGDYETVRNMTTKDNVKLSGNVITIDSVSDKLYYEGTLKSQDLPWQVKIDYTLDGQPIAFEKLPGVSGKLGIKLAITKNKNLDGFFFDNYALQINVVLNSLKTKNLQAEGATIANVGQDTQLTYTVLPGNEKELEILADVTDLEMDGIAINGIKLSLDVDIDDQELMGQVNELLDAIAKLDDGAGTLHDGAGKLNNGADDLNDGASALNEGVSKLKAGVESDLQNGVSQLADGSQELRTGAADLVSGGSDLHNGAADLSSAMSTLNNGINDLNSGIGKVQDGLDTLDSKSNSLVKGSQAVQKALNQIGEALNGISVSGDQITQLVEASAAIQQGIDSLVDGAFSLQSAVSYSAYKATMDAGGLDIDYLESQNSAAADSTENLIAALKYQVSEFDGLPGYEGLVATLQQQIGALQNFNQLFRGNNALISGTQQYFSGLSDGVAKVYDGAVYLQGQYQQFDRAIGALANTLNSLLYSMSQLTEGINVLITQYDTLDEGINAYTDGVSQLVDGYQTLSSGSSELLAGSHQLVAGSDTLYDGTTALLNGLVDLYDGTGSLTDGTGDLKQGTADLIFNIAKLANGSNELLDGTTDLKEGTVDLKDGTGELKDGTGTMRDETSGMDSEINNKIDDMLGSLSGDNVETRSFVSADNSHVKSVQFVIKTPDIEIPAVDATPAPAEPEMTFWQKILHLFGLY